MKSKKSKLALSATAVVALGAVAATYAYWSNEATIANPFNTSSYGTTVIEDFSPDDGEDWQPGATVDKEVFVTNTGDYDLIVRAKLDETWTNADGSTYKTVTAETDTNTGDDIYGDVYTVSQDDVDDGLTTDDESVVTKNITNTTEWVAGGDGWYYYYVNLEAGKTTESWLESVTLIGDVDLGVYNTVYSVTAEAEDVDGETVWITYDPALGMPTHIYSDGTLLYSDGTLLYSDGEDGYLYDETSDATSADDLDAYTVGELTNVSAVTYNTSVTTLDETNVGYSDSDYVLTVTIQTVQATEDAVEGMFGWTDITTDTPSGATWTFVDSETE